MSSPALVRFVGILLPAGGFYTEGSGDHARWDQLSTELGSVSDETSWKAYQGLIYESFDLDSNNQDISPLAPFCS